MPKEKFTDRVYDWKPEGVRDLSRTILVTLTQSGRLSPEDLTQVRAAHRFIHDVGEFLTPSKGKVFRADVLAAHSVARPLFGDDMELKKLLGASRNVMVALEKSASSTRVELNRAIIFFDQLYSGLNQEVSQ